MYRDQCNFQKMGMNLSIEECLKCYQGGYSKMCDLCKSSDGSSYENIFSTTKILIFYFKRNNHLFKGDIDFNMKLEMYNKTYNLKACISSYSNQKYFSDVFINNIWYRYLEDKVEMLGDVNKQIHEYETQCLIYELEEINNSQYILNQNNNQIFENPFNYNINGMIMNNRFNNINFIPYQQYREMLNHQQQQQLWETNQMIHNYNMYRLMNNMMINNTINFENNNNNNNNSNTSSNNNNTNNIINNNSNTQNEIVINNQRNVTIKFLIVPKDWDKNEDNTYKIFPQITLEDTVEEAINNFFIKLQMDRKVIAEFKFKDKTIEANSKEKLKDIGVVNNSQILAIKSDEFKINQ